MTVIIPTRDRPQQVRAAVEGVLRQQYGGALDVIVVFDQHPVDPGLGHLARPGRPVRLLGNARTPGLAGARNSGIHAAQGDLIAFCDDDDLWLPGKLSAQVEVLGSRPDAILVTCGIVVRHGHTETVRVLHSSTVTHADLLRSRLVELHPSTFVARRADVVGLVGVTSEEIPGSYAEDYEWLLRISRYAPLAVVDRPLVRVLWSEGSYFTARWRTIESALTWLLERYPEFADEPVGRARIRGQVAFARAAAGDHRGALRAAREAWNDSWREPRTYLALAVASGVLRADHVRAVLHRRGRGI